MYATQTRTYNTDVDFMAAHDICMDVMVAHLAQARKLRELAKAATGKERKRLFKLEIDAMDSVTSFHHDAQLAKEGNVRICKKAFLEYNDLLKKLDEENGREQIYNGQRGQQPPVLRPA